jgi:hypothetical protein
MKATLTFALLLAAYIAAGVASLDPFMLVPAGAAGALISCAIWRSAHIKTYIFISLAALLAPLIGSVFLNWYAIVRQPMNGRTDFLQSVLFTLIPSIILFTVPAALVALITLLLVRVILYWRRGDRSRT